jgi:hypothetical protein
MIRSLSFCLFSPFKTFLVCMHFCYWTHTIICQLKLLYIYLVYQFSLISQFFSLCVLQWNILIIFVGLIFTLQKYSHFILSKRKKSDELNEWMNASHTLSLPSNICKNIVRRSIASLHDSHEKVHTKWKPMRYYYNMLVMSITRLGHSTLSRVKKIGCQTCDQSSFL